MLQSYRSPANYQNSKAIAISKRLSFMRWSLRDLLRMAVGITTFLFSAWLAFMGGYSNLIRIQSAMFPVSGGAFLLMLLGLFGGVSCLAMIGSPHHAGIAAS